MHSQPLHAMFVLALPLVCWHATVASFTFPVILHASFTRRGGGGRGNEASRKIISSRRRSVSHFSTFCRMTKTDEFAWWALGGEDEDGNSGSNSGSSSSTSGGDKFRGGPASTTFDMDELRYRIARNQILGPGVQPDEEIPDEVHIILFYPDTDNEGVHTIEFPKGSGNNVILAFECERECGRFALLLKDQHFFDPSAYCKTLGVEVQVVPKGTHLVPPSGAVDELGHNPLLKKAQASLNRLYYEQATLQGQAYNDDNDGDGLASPSPMLREGILDDDEGSWA